MDNLYGICKQLNFKPKKCLEIGAAHPLTTQLKEFIADGTECILVEGSPRLAFCLREGWNFNDFKESWPNPPNGPYANPGFKDLKNVTLHNVAITDAEGDVKFYECNASSFVGGVTSPAKINDHYTENDKDSCIVKGVKISSIDPGDIELLAADCEGSEWYCLSSLISRPKLICLETHGQNYRNPYLKEIARWMQDNNYSIIHQTESDTLFLKN